jgi:nitroimidazol reductase NimA-like FMN-containing flavoprotein (pyridoxamine 5'-phosphate oxidase superfamily)
VSTRPRPTVRMDPDEIWDFVRDAHTGVLTTLKADGSPVSLPLWFAVVEREIYMQSRGKKLARLRRNPVSSFLVEDGERWAELRAVHMAGKGYVVVPEPAVQEAIAAEMERKYATYRTSTTQMPSATQAAYAQMAVVKFVPGGKVLNWNNAKLGTG